MTNNILTLLATLANSNAEYVYSANYNRIGDKVEDGFNMFKWNDEPHTTPLRNLVWNEDKLNVSIRTMIRGTVSLNPKQAKKVGLPSVIDSQIFRNQTIIKDGKLNMERIKVNMDTDTLKAILAENIDLVTSKEKTNEGYEVELDLTTIPVITDEYIATPSELLASVKRNNELTAESKVLKALYKELDDTVQYGNLYTEEQIEVLKEYGVDANGNYVGIANEVTEVKEHTPQRNVTLQIKGDAKVPSVNEVLKKAPTKGVKLYMFNYYNDKKSEIESLTAEDKRDNLKKAMANVNKMLNTNKLGINTNRIARAILDDWNGFDTDNKGNRVYTDGTDTLVVKDEVK